MTPGFGAIDPAELGVRVTTHAVDPSPADDGASEETRPRRLHAKVVLLEGARSALAYVGSANFTRNGLGCPGANANIEAGLILRGDAETLRRSVLPPTKGPVVDFVAELAKDSANEPEEDRKVPTFVRGAWLEPSSTDTKTLRLRLQLDVNRIQGDWSVRIQDTTRVLVAGQAGGDAEPTTALEPSDLEALLRNPVLEVLWWDAAEPAEYPINVVASARHDLPLSPGAGDPSESALLSYYQGRIRFEDMFPLKEERDQAKSTAAELRPQESRVDTSKIQSYQVKSFVEALAGLREDLARAATSTKARMQRAVLGPVSPLALAREIVAQERSGARSAVAAGFELVEILFCLGEAKTTAAESEDWTKTVDQGTEAVRSLLIEMIQRRPELGQPGTAFARYSTHALEPSSGGLGP
jgi:hypothetical protein